MARPEWGSPYFDHDPPITGDGFHILDSRVEVDRDNFEGDTMTFTFKVAINGTPNVLALVKAMGRMFAEYVCRGFGISTPDVDQLDKLYFTEEEEKEIDYSYKAKRKIDLGES